MRTTRKHARTRRAYAVVGLAVLATVPAFLTRPITALALTQNLTVNLTTDSVSDPGRWNLQIDGVTDAPSVGNGGTTGPQNVTSSPSPGTAHNIDAVAVTGTPAAAFTANVSCNNGVSVTGATLPFGVNVVDGTDLVCTITRVRQTGGGSVAASVIGSGSDTTQFVMHQLDGLYLFSPGCQQINLPGGTKKWYDFSCMAPDPAGTVTTENYAHDQVHESYFLGSGNGLHQLCNQNVAGNAPIDYARSSRVYKNSDCAGLKFVAFARDAIPWEAFTVTGSGIGAGLANASGGCSGSGLAYCLTTTQLQHIFIGGGPGSGTSGCTAFWDEDGIGGAHVPINPYTPQSGSGTRLTWDADMGSSSDFCINTRGAAYAATHIVDENQNNSILVTNNDAANAIFPFSFGVWATQVNFKNNAILGAIDGIPAVKSNVSSGLFPTGRFLYNVYATAAVPAGTHASSAQAVSYVGEEGWICKTVANHGTNPVTGNNFHTDIANTINQSGFAALASGVIGGGDNNVDFCKLLVTQVP